MITFDQTKIRKDDGQINLDAEGEAVRLYNSLLPKPARNEANNPLRPTELIFIPAVRGIDLKTASFNDCINYLADTRIKKSQSQITFVHRWMAVNFDTEYTQNRDKIDARFKLEYEMIQSKAKSDVAWLGEVGFSGQVRLDGSLTQNRNRTVKQRNGEIKIVRK